MAISKGRASVEAGEIKRFVGVGSVFVLAVNPNKTELEKLYNTSLDKEPEYVGKGMMGDTEVDQVRVDFIVKTDPEKNDNIEMTTRATYFVRKAYRFNKDNTKVQVIDKYGRTAWVTKEQCQNHEIPMYSNGPANLDKDYRPCYVGEEDLTNFIKAYLNIPNVMKYVNGSWIPADNPEECELRLDSIEKYFKGDFSELKEVVTYQPTNKVKLLFGVRTSNEGNQYQTVYTQMALKNGVNDYSKLAKDVEERKANGAYSTTEFEVCNLKEYDVNPTNFNETPAETADPFSTNESGLPW